MLRVAALRGWCQALGLALLSIAVETDRPVLVLERKQNGEVGFQVLRTKHLVQASGNTHAVDVFDLLAVQGQQTAASGFSARNIGVDHACLSAGLPPGCMATIRVVGFCFVFLLNAR